MDALEKLVTKFVNLQITFPEDEHTSNIRVDTVEVYAKEVMSLGLLLMEFRDAIREGDGSRIFLLLPIFFALV